MLLNRSFLLRRQISHMLSAFLHQKYIVFVFWSNVSSSDDPEVLLSISYPVAHKYERRHHLKKKKMQIWTLRLSSIGKLPTDQNVIIPPICMNPSTKCQKRNQYLKYQEEAFVNGLPGSSGDQILMMSEQKYWWYLSPAQNQLLKYWNMVNHS